MKTWFKYFLIGFVFTSCGKNEFFNEDKSIKGGEWEYNSKIEFDIDVTDTVSFYDFYVDFRHNDNYAYSDIYLFFDVLFPNGKVANDTIHYVMQDYSGKWFGRNSGSLIENHVMIKPKTRFPVSGKYKMRIGHAMRDEKLAGIEDVGLTISKKE